jgi:pilus assembly protein CpaB
MKRAQIIGIGVAASTGLIAFMMIQSLVNKPQVEKTVEVQVKSTDVLVARADIGLGQIANESLLRWQSWPEEAVTPEFITRSGNPTAMLQLAGAIARSPVMAGEPVTAKKLIKAGQGGVLAAILPAGMRAISTRIKEETAVGRLIIPNDHVDVILTYREKGRNNSSEQVSETLFRNVRVLAIGQQIESKGGKKTSEGKANTATLELTPGQAEDLAQANARGEISLSLRSIADLGVDGDGPLGSGGNKSKGSKAVQILRYGIRSRVNSVN